MRFELASERLESDSAQLQLHADGVPVAAVRPEPWFAQARGLLARGHAVAARVAAGVAAGKERAAAMVLAWTDLLEQSVIDPGGRDLSEVTKRAMNERHGVEQLARALADFEAEGDAYGDRRGGFLAAAATWAGAGPGR